MKVIFKSTTDLICKKHIGITGNIEMKNGTLYFFHDGNLLMTVDILQRYSIGQTLYVISYEARYSFLIPSKIKFKKITLPRWTKDVLDYQNNFTSQSYIVVLQNILEVIITFDHAKTLNEARYYLHINTNYNYKMLTHDDRESLWGLKVTLDENKEQFICIDEINRVELGIAFNYFKVESHHEIKIYEIDGKEYVKREDVNKFFCLYPI